MYDFRDLDLMLKIVDKGDSDGWVETADLASALGFPDDDLRPVGIRLAWMHRYGMLDHSDRDRAWRLSAGGERVVEARLRAAQARALDALPDEALIDVMANVVTHRRLGNPMVANMLRREFMFGTKRR
jgi:hypothetical protein